MRHVSEALVLITLILCCFFSCQKKRDRAAEADSLKREAVTRGFATFQVDTNRVVTFVWKEGEK